MEWGGRGRDFRHYLQRQELWKGVYGARTDEKPTPQLEHVLGGGEFVPSLPFPSEQSGTGLAWTSQAPGSLLTGRPAAGKPCSVKLQ